MTLKISAPLHLTGFFRPHFSNNPLLAGSTGAGLVIAPGLNCVCKLVNTEPQAKVNKVLYNGVKIKIKPVEKLFELTNFKKGALFKISSPVPLGFGYGASAASTLAVSLAIHRFSGESDLKAAKMAHIAEVKSLTGLGDVLAIFEGKGLSVRVKAGAPGIGQVKSFSEPRYCGAKGKMKTQFSSPKQLKKIRIITADLRKIDTKKILKSITPETANFAAKMTKNFNENPNLEDFFEYSRLFAKKMGFADENFFKKMEPFKKYCIGFSVKKGVFFAAAEQSKLKNAVSMFKKFSPAVHIFKLGGGVK